MKKDIHPDYRFVIFQDNSCDLTIRTRSTVQTKDKITWEDGQEYPLVQLDISSGSHPFFTGKQKLLDAAGRIDRLKKKFGDKVALGSQKKKKPEAPKLTMRERLRAAAMLDEKKPEETSAEKKD